MIWKPAVETKKWNGQVSTVWMPRALARFRLWKGWLAKLSFESSKWFPSRINESTKNSDSYHFNRPISISSSFPLDLTTISNCCLKLLFPTFLPPVPHPFLAQSFGRSRPAWPARWSAAWWRTWRGGRPRGSPGCCRCWSSSGWPPKVWWPPLRRRRRSCSCCPMCSGNKRCLAKWEGVVVV